MLRKLSYSHFLSTFPSDESCLEEFKKLRYPNGIYCIQCQHFVKHYKIQGRSAYSCKNCRSQCFPLKGTIMEKSTTPLRIWFYAMFIMIHTRSDISIRQLQKELGVTYKTAWRMYKNIKLLMLQNNGDLLIPQKEKIHKWTLFSKLEITLTHKEDLENEF